MRFLHTVLAMPLIAGAGAISAPAPASAFDMDCKLLLCLPGGFPANCGDAYDHMVDRLRDGKSPIGHCDTSGGDRYEDYEIDYSFQEATEREGWQCPGDSSLAMAVHRREERGFFGLYRVNTICYEERTTSYFGDDNDTFIGTSIPERTDFTLEMTYEPGTEHEFNTGQMRFDSGVVGDPRIIHNPSDPSLE